MYLKPLHEKENIEKPFFLSCLCVVEGIEELLLSLWERAFHLGNFRWDLPQLDPHTHGGVVANTSR